MKKNFDNQIVIKSQKQTPINNINSQNNVQRINDMRKMIENYSFGLNDIIYKNNFCKIFTGIDIRNQQPVAIKAVQLKTLNKDSHQQLQTQIQYVKNLPKNKNIVNVFDIFCTSNNCYFIMQLCKIDLKSYLKKKKVLSEAEFYPILSDIIDAIAFLHQKDYIYSNLKLSNILLSKNGSKLCDFSKCQNTKKQQQFLKQIKQWNPYMCPDTLLTKKYSYKNDIWAIGVIAYQCLHGYHSYPWKFQTFQSLLQKIYQNNIKYSPTLSQKVVNFIQKCLNPKLDLNIQQILQDKFIKQLKKSSQSIEPLNSKNNSVKPNLPIHWNKNINQKNELQLTSPHLQKITSNGRCQILQNLKNQNLQNVQDCVNSEINFMRFTYIIYQFEQKYSNKQYQIGDNKQMNSMLDSFYFKAILIKQILVQRQNLKLMFRKNTVKIQFNPFHIKQLTVFFEKVSNSQKIKHYATIIEQYNIKYQNLQKQFDFLIDLLNKQIKPTTFQWRSKDILLKDYKRTQVLPIFGVRLARDKCKLIWKQIQQHLINLDKQQKNESKQKIIDTIQGKALYLDFVISYYLINCILLDDFTDSQRFSHYSQISTILDNKPSKIQISLLWMIEDKLKRTKII